ncbi:nuclear transport factor 2 family protein [Levilactobacillus tujiorum]|uniref:Nuclear transport factor 2 family protein n=1 Tax=Levilactobacillus tujiorum TaxID=2912243 RepID=A0ABX1LC35_9LACO|nr:nuclear transport factor 2 family protein [Levilactobacillus tujiorum]MCH5465529.1 nuclear transport factor 2 family protein [Levilactobacillus tujiorum]NLR12735.1 nuclear transport factor 2 family protein [Lactobacillus sp. HBUAS51387]NLR30650.1 nuclear transport factor 2 family protein [Levilactobacillus tujiorum]
MNDEILNLYRAFNTAMAADDTVTLDQLLAPTFTLTHMTGYVQPRAEWLREIQQGTMRYFSSVEDRVTMKETATDWQVTGQNRVVASIHGSRQHEWPLNTVMTVSKVEGKWQIAAAVVTTY